MGLLVADRFLPGARRLDETRGATEPNVQSLWPDVLTRWPLNGMKAVTVFQEENHDTN